MKGKTVHVLLSILTIAIALVVINFLANRYHERLDLTERSLYTLSPSTVDLLKNLEDVVTVRVYFSTNLPPALMALKRGVGDMLDEFKSVTGHRIQVEYMDPTKGAMAEQKALSLGIMPVQLDVVGKDRMELAKVYLGMVLLHGDRMEVLPVVLSMANLEYRLAQAIIKVSSVEEFKVGWLESGAVSPDEVGGGYEGLIRVLSQRYNIERIAPKDFGDVDLEKFNTLVVASPGELGEEVLSTIDRYLSGGGKIVALVELWDIKDNMTAALKKTDFTDLLSRYGVTVNRDMVLDRSNAIASFTGAAVTYHIPYPFWPKVRTENLSNSDPITAELSSLVLPWTSSLTLSDEISDRSEVLARSTDMAMVKLGENPRIDPETAGGEIEQASNTASYPLAVRVRLPEGGSLLVVGSGMFAQDTFLRLFASNMAFIENAIDVLTMGNKLVGIRSRVGIDRPIAILSDAMPAVIRVGNILIGPLIVLLIGLLIFLSRRWRRKSVKANFGG